MRAMQLLLGSMATVAVFATGSTATAQAARESAKVKLGATSLSIEYGAPQWNESRKGQMESGVAIGGVWRLGADTRTTFVVEGGDVAIGDQLVESGGYGLNLRRVGAKEWAFVVYDGSDTNVAADDNEWQVASVTSESADAPPPALSIEFVTKGTATALQVRFGPMVVSAPVAAVEASEADLAIAGEQGGARWFSRAAASAPPAGSWMRAGRVSNFYVGDLDGAFDVDLKLAGDQAVVRFQNREKAKLAARVARLAADVEAAKQRAAAAKSDRVRQAVERSEAALKAKQDELAALAAAPDAFELPIKLAAAKKQSGKLGAMLVRRGKKLFAVVDADGKSGEAELDEARIVPAKSGG